MSRLLFEHQGVTFLITLSDSVTITDSLSISGKKILSDSVSVTDALSLALTKGLSESVSLTDSLKISSTKGLSDAVNVADSLVVTHILPSSFVETITIGDSVSVSIVRNVFFASLRTADFRGGAQLILLGGALDMRAASDDFSTPTLLPIWSDTSAGGGSVVPAPSARALKLDTGSLAGGVAAIETVATTADLDAEVRFRLAALDQPRGASIVFGRLALVAGAARAELSLIADDRGRSAAVRIVVGGVEMDRVVQPIAADATSGTLRILRAGARIYFFVGGQELIHFEGFGGAAKIEIAAENDAALASQAVTYADAYLRRPVVRFGDEPMLDYASRGATHGFGSTPRVPASYDTVDVTVTGALFTLVNSRYFTFTRPRDLLRFETRDAALVITSDPVLTKRRGSS